MTERVGRCSSRRRSSGASLPIRRQCPRQDVRASDRSAPRYGRSSSSPRRPPLDEWRARPRRQRSLRTSHQLDSCWRRRKMPAPSIAPVHWADGSEGDMNFGVTSLAAPNAASSRVARYSFTARLAVSGSLVFCHSEPGIDCLCMPRGQAAAHDRQDPRM
jgi:hypothetical protein